MKHKYLYILLVSFTLSFVAIVTLTRSYGVQPIHLPNRLYVGRDGELLDLNGFQYILSGQACKKNITHIQIITSYAGNVEARSAIRRAYPSVELEKQGVARVFLLATLPPFHEVSQNALVNEHKRFYDLVQGNFVESYKNLTYKHVMGLKWALKYCKDVNFIIKSDDDILVDMYSLLNVIEKKKFEMMGYVLKEMRPIRIKANKWYVTKNEYSGESYPQFLSGWLYIVKREIAEKLLSYVRDFKYFWIDDLFLTGMVAQKANVTLTDISDLFTLHPEVVECCIRKGMKCDFIASPNDGDHSLHNKFQKHVKHCYVEHCPTLKPGLKIEDRCVAKRRLPPLKKGLPKITVIQ